MKNYYRVMLGKKSAFAEECFAGNYIGAGFIFQQDLSGNLPDEWREFNKRFIPIWQKAHPDKSKIAAGLSCGFLWTIAKGIHKGDIVLCPDGTGSYRVGEVCGDYSYVPGNNLPHQRAIQWFSHLIDRSAMSIPLRNSAGSIGTVSDISRYRDELEKLIGGDGAPALIASDPDVEDPAAFAMEKHLEDFLVQNWPQTDLGKKYDIFEEDGEKVGQQYQTDTGPLDILAISKDRKELLVVELKKGRASDVVVGQTLRYMGYVLEELAEKGQSVSGVIIALENDPKLQRALIATPNIHFYRYQISFKLLKS
jgi:restriction system protein